MFIIPKNTQQSKMKFTSIIASALFFSSIMAAPIAEASLAASVNATVPAAAQPINDTMSGAAASASISINRNDANAQNSGSERTLRVSIALPIAIIFAIFLV